MKLLALVLALGIYAHAQTAEQLTSGSLMLTPGCVANIPGHWNDSQLSAANIFAPRSELGGFTVTVNGVACPIQSVGPERLVFWMPVTAPIGDYSAIVNSPTLMRSVALHVVEAAPSLSIGANGIIGLYAMLAMPIPRLIGAGGLIEMPRDGASVIVSLFVSGMNPAARLDREVIFIRAGDFLETRFPVLGVSAPGGPYTIETLTFVLQTLPAGEYWVVVRVGTEFSEPEKATINSNGREFRPHRPAWLVNQIQ